MVVVCVCVPRPRPVLTRPHSLRLVLYPRMKKVLKWRGFANVAEIQRELLSALDNVSVEDFRQCFQQWEHCRDRCVQSQGQCFEGD